MSDMILDNAAEMKKIVDKTIEVADKLGKAVEQESTPAHQLVAFVNSRFEEASTARKTVENKWLTSYRLWRGEYSPEEQHRFNAQVSRNDAASKVFIKVTKTKVQAVYGQLLEVLFAGNKFPIGIEHTPVPEGVPEVAHLSDKPGEGGGSASKAVDYYGYSGDGRDIAPGTTRKDLMNAVGNKLKAIINSKTVVSGPALDKNAQLELYPARDAAFKLEKTMHDQLVETSANVALRRTILELCIFGTGVLKGPFNEYIIVDHWDLEDGKNVYKPYKRLSPRFEPVSCWNFYPDPEARTLEDAEYVIERHMFSKSALRALVGRPGYSKESILELLEEGPKPSTEGWEGDIKDAKATDNTRYDVKEYWGYLTCELARKLELDLEDIEDLLDVVQVQAVVVQGKCIKLALNPYVPVHIPYVLAPYEEHPSQIWGISIPENMSDTQELMNGHMRMAIDNLKLAGNVMLEVDENRMVTGEDFKVYPGKVWRKNGGAPGQAIFGITFPNTSQSHYFAFDKARQLADEAVGVPSFSHGITGVSSTGRTAAGMSMLMSAAALGVKTVISNIDHYILKPLGEKLFRWNMQFNDVQIEVRGDYKIVAQGTSSLMAREVRSQRLLSFLQVTMSNPATAPMVNVRYILQELAKSQDLDPDKSINDIQAAQLMAAMMQQAGGMNGQGAVGEATAPSGQEGGASLGGTPQALGAQTQAGPAGGNIGVGSAPIPGEGSYSGRA